MQDFGGNTTRRTVGPHIAACLLSAILATGCAPSKPGVMGARVLPDAFPNHTAVQVLSMTRSGRDSLTSFRARASIAVHSPDQNARFTGLIDFRRDDSLHLDIRAPLGIGAARALVTPDSFFVHDRIKRRLYYGDISKAGPLLPIPVSGPDMFYAMLGLALSADEEWEMTADTSQYYFESPDGRTRIAVDPRYWRVTSFRRYDADGALAEEGTYGDFDLIEGIMLPRRVVLARPADKTLASIYYTRLDLNPPSLDLALSVGSNARRIEVN